MTLQDILYPITLADFFENYYEKKHLVIKKKQPNFFEKTISVSKLDEMVSSVSNHYPQFRIADNAKEEQPKHTEFTVKGTELIDPIKFLKHFESGATLVMSGLQHKVFSLRKLTNELEFFFKHRVQTNIYLTPKNAQGFATHYDTHDVFVFQFEGKKSWRIYNNAVPLADKLIPFKKEGFVAGEITDEFILEQGDVLYIPRGIVHDANCLDVNSGHITTGLLGKTWAEHLAEMIMEESRTNAKLRKFTKFHQVEGLDYSTEKEEIKTLVASIIDKLQNNPDIVDDFHSKQKPQAIGQLQQIMNMESINAKSKIKLRDKNKIRLSKKEDKIALKYFDLELDMPQNCEPFIQKLMLQNKAEQLDTISCDLDNESKILLSQELTKMGLVEIYN